MARLDANVKGRGVRVQPLAAPTEGIWIRIGGITDTPRSKATVHHMAGGKKLAVSYDATDEMMRYTITLAPYNAGKTMRGWVDDIVVVRDSHGRVRVGILRDAAINTPARLNRERIMGFMALELVTHSLEI